MINLYAIWTIARVETKLLLRSWAFRIFSAFGLLVIIMLDIFLGTSIVEAPHTFRALAGALPLMNLKLLNVLQGIIAIFLATEFIKRDRQHDSTQVIFVRSFSNADYVIGKMAGIGGVFVVLNVLVLAMALIIDLFFSPTAFAWGPYFLYPLLISLPTVMFIIGLSFLLITVLRSQALVFVLMLGYSLVVLIPVREQWFFIFDVFAFHLPMTWSDFTAMSNWPDLIRVRGLYCMAGLACAAATVLTTRRLRQSHAVWITAVIGTIVSLGVGTYAAYSHIDGKLHNRSYRSELRETTRPLAAIEGPAVLHYEIDMSYNGSRISNSARLQIVNESTAATDSILLTLNPGLTVTEVSRDSTVCEFRQRDNAVWVHLPHALDVNDTCVIAATYNGTIDDRYCFLDVSDERIETPVLFWVFRVGKRASVVSDAFVHLSPECGWYPMTGPHQGAAFPHAVRPQYATYTLTVRVPEDQIAISQGQVSVERDVTGQVYRFVTEKKLPQISITIGNYEQREITVENTSYSLFTRPGHDYFVPFFDSLSDTVSFLLTQMRNEYETRLGIQYPHRRLQLVEVPVQIASYHRLWTIAHEVVQPEIVFLPEMGVFCGAADLHRLRDISDENQERMNQAESVTQSQSRYFTTFVKTALLGLQEDFRRGMRSDESFESDYTITSNCVSYMTRVTSSQWPVLGHALESHLKSRIEPPQFTRFRFFRGITPVEEANRTLNRMSLADLVASEDLDATSAGTALAAKGRFLFALAESEVGKEVFNECLDSLLAEHQHEPIQDTELLEMINQHAGVDFNAVLKDWYEKASLPGYVVSNVHCYEVFEGDRKKTQLKFTISNPTDDNGIVELQFRYRQRERGMRRRRMARDVPEPDLIHSLPMPANTAKDIAMILDQPPAEMGVETFVSRNIPSVFTYRFRDLELKKREVPVECETERPADLPNPRVTGMYVVDNEDAGFSILNLGKEFWLRRALLSIFDPESSDTTYEGIRPWDPPSNWLPTTDQNFYGTFARSGQHKEPGDGRSVVRWTTHLEESGDYNIYYYWYGDLSLPGRWRERWGGGNLESGEKEFKIYHADGIDEFALDLDMAEEGWNMIGSYRLKAGEARIELSDEGEGTLITADAVKWVKQ